MSTKSETCLHCKAGRPHSYHNSQWAHKDGGGIKVATKSKALKKRSTPAHKQLGLSLREWRDEGKPKGHN